MPVQRESSCRVPIVGAFALDGQQLDTTYPFLSPEPITYAGGVHVQDDALEWTALTLAIQEGERRRIASELHDGLGQKLSLLLMELRNATQVVAGCGRDAATANASLERASIGARSVINELRRSVMALYPSILDDLGLVAGLSWMLREVSEAQPGLAIESSVPADDADVPRRLHITVFRIVQEALNNVLKHAHAKEFHVVLRGSATGVMLMIEDDGCGMTDPDAAMLIHRGGLAGMMRRARAAGGDFRIFTEMGGGTRITVCWPKECLS
ncbi:sensor histidine kinase [Telluria sp. Tellsp104]